MSIKGLLQKMNGKKVQITYILRDKDNNITTREDIINSVIKQLNDQNIKFTMDDKTIRYCGTKQIEMFWLPPNNYAGILTLRSKDYYVLRDIDSQKAYGSIPKVKEIIEITDTYLIKNINGVVIKMELLAV